VDQDGRRTDTITLACTHYPLLLVQFTRLAPWPVAWVDPAPAIARRVVDLTGKPGGSAGPPVRAVFTSGKPPSPALAKALAGFGVGEAEPATIAKAARS
jgi:glutamate racemase